MTKDNNRKARPYMPKSWGSISGEGNRGHSIETTPDEPAVLTDSYSIETVPDEPDYDTDFGIHGSDEELTEYPCCHSGDEPVSTCSDCHLMDDSPEFPVEDDAESATVIREDESRPSRVTTRTVVRISGVRFSRAGKVYHFESGDMDLVLGDWVIVKTEKGVGLGHVAMAPCDRELEPAQREGLRKIVRKAGKVDFDQKIRCRKREAEAYAYCLERIEALALPMKLVAVECFFDGSKYVFYFTAEGRVDFRELVKQLVARFPVRIEMRQIGVRHEAKMTGGIATCGQELCCSRFLTDFRPVSVKMAKNQNLSLNPTKISGVCGRLMCCLAYEHGIYEVFRKGLPKVGKAVRTTKGDGVVVKYNPLRETICVRMAEDVLLEVTREEIVRDSAPWIEDDTDQQCASDDLDGSLREDEQDIERDMI